MKGETLLHRLYRSLRERMRLFRAETSGHGASHTIRTEVTVERKETTVLVGGVTSGTLDTCPLCGHRLVPAQAAQVRARLEGGPGSRKAPPG
jgi:hypothetical protein